MREDRGPLLTLRSAKRVSKDDGFLPFRDYPPSGLPQWPQWLLDKLITPEPQRPVSLEPIGDWRKRPTAENNRDLAAICGVLWFVAHAPKGERNSRLFWGACRMHEFVMRGLASSTLGFDDLEKAAAATGLKGAWAGNG